MAATRNIERQIGETVRRIICKKGCPEQMIFSSLEDLCDHYHYHPRHNQCKYCIGNIFEDQLELQAHVNLFHMAQGRYLCLYCPERFRHPDSLAQHVWLHPTNKPYYCYFCQMHFTTQETREAHRRGCLDFFPLEKSQSRFKCENCRTVCIGLDSYYSHNARVHEEFICRTCVYGVKFPTFVAMIEHVKSHPQCKYCLYRRFKSSDDLEAHVQIHHQGPPYECTFCPHGFETLDSLLNHTVSSHENSVSTFRTRVRCRWCENTFTPDQAFIRHTAMTEHQVSVFYIATTNLSLSLNQGN